MHLGTDRNSGSGENWLVPVGNFGSGRFLILTTTDHPLSFLNPTPTLTTTDHFLSPDEKHEFYCDRRFLIPVTSVLVISPIIWFKNISNFSYVSVMIGFYIGYNLQDI